MNNNVSENKIVLLGFGANLGDRRENILAAARALEGAGVHILKMSSFYRTSPVGVTDQPEFVNCAAVAETSLDPRALLRAVKTIEADMGRDPGALRWGPRVVDIDILFYDDISMDAADLTVPHPRVRERLFVILPLLEIAPDFTAPDGRSLSSIFTPLLELPDFSCQFVEKMP